MTSDLSSRHEENRAAWNEAAAHYEREIECDIAFLQAGGTDFVSVERPFLRDLSTWCRRAIHLQCAGGRDTLSLWNLGAREVVGIDLSDRMIAVAERKSRALGAPASWYCCDVLAAPAGLNGTADLIYTGRGALCWLMDLDLWAQTIVRLLAPQGRLYVFESHPLCWLWDLSATDWKLDPNPPFGNYFSTDVSVSQGWPESYIPAAAVPSRTQQSRKHERQWTLGQIINALVGRGLRLERFEEHAESYWNQFPQMPRETRERLPQTFSLLMRKDERG